MSPPRLPDAQRDLELHPLQGLLRLSPHALRRHRLFLKALSPANTNRLASNAASYSLANRRQYYQRLLLMAQRGHDSRRYATEFGLRSSR
jgi:hypothetical protein